jgi:hypothetical protein
MIRFRTFLLLLAIAALLVSAAPVFAGTTPVASPLTGANLCAAPALSPAAGTPAPSFKVAPPVDYILCSCSFCKSHPDVDCQVSPSGYSIACSDWYRLHC